MIDENVERQAALRLMAEDRERTAGAVEQSESIRKTMERMSRAVTELRAWRKEHDTLPPLPIPSRPRQSTRLWWWTGAAAAVILLAWGVFNIMGGSADKAPRNPIHQIAATSVPSSSEMAICADWPSRIAGNLSKEQTSAVLLAATLPTCAARPDNIVICASLSRQLAKPYFRRFSSPDPAP